MKKNTPNILILFFIIYLALIQQCLGKMEVNLKLLTPPPEVGLYLGKLENNNLIFFNYSNIKNSNAFHLFNPKTKEYSVLKNFNENILALNFWESGFKILNDNNIFFAGIKEEGGNNNNGAALYEFKTGKFKILNNMIVNRKRPSVFKVDENHVAIFGGTSNKKIDKNHYRYVQGEIYDIKNGTSELTAPFTHEPSAYDSQDLMQLKNGNIMFFNLDKIEIYDIKNNVFKSVSFNDRSIIDDLQKTKMPIFTPLEDNMFSVIILKQHLKKPYFYYNLDSSFYENISINYAISNIDNYYFHYYLFEVDDNTIRLISKTRLGYNDHLSLYPISNKYILFKKREYVWRYSEKLGLYDARTRCFKTIDAKAIEPYNIIEINSKTYYIEGDNDALLEIKQK